MITISTNLLEAIAKWSYPDTDRPHISVVAFTEGFAVATDGHRLVRVPVAADGETFSVGRNHLLSAVAAQRALHVLGPHEIDLTLDGKNVRIDIGPAGTSRGRSAVSLLVPVGSDGFPPYEQVIPADSEGGPPTRYLLSTKYLAAIDEVHTAAGGGPQNGVYVVAWSDDKLGPLKLRGAMGSEFLIMPMRGE